MADTGLTLAHGFVVNVWASSVAGAVTSLHEELANTGHVADCSLHEYNLSCLPHACNSCNAITPIHNGELLANKLHVLNISFLMVLFQ